MSPISPVLPGSPWAKAHLVLRIDQRLVEVAVEELSLRLNKREQIVEEVPVIRLTGFFPCPQSFCLHWSYLNSKQYRRAVNGQVGIRKQPGQCRPSFN